MEIRQIKYEDLDRIYELLNELYDNKIRYEKFKEIYKLKLEDNNCYYIVAVLDKKIVGVLTLELNLNLHRFKKQSFIEDLMVDKEC